jgi:hypothetical protein
MDTAAPGFPAQVERSLYSTIYLAKVFAGFMEEDDWRENFIKEENRSLWTEVLQALTLRFLSTARNRVTSMDLSWKLLSEPFLLKDEPRPLNTEDNLEEVRSFEARLLFYHTFMHMIWFILIWEDENRAEEIPPECIPQDLRATFETAYIHHSAWSNLSTLDNALAFPFFKVLIKRHLPELRNQRSQGIMDVHREESLARDLLLTICNKRLNILEVLEANSTLFDEIYL